MRSQVFQFRLSGEEKARIRENAARAGVDPSEWVRLRALEEGQGNRGGPPLGREPLDEATQDLGRAPVPPRAFLTLSTGGAPDPEAERLYEEALEADRARREEMHRVSRAKLLEPTVAFRCPNGHPLDPAPTSARAKCGSCGRTVVPG